ncbi:VaFE repeat-containing surface-anchored protein [Microbacterium mangrovi]|uniref:VaFE repeat-containing surface-anchored protein n=1 Tax=Microbacterium mangrovi TaxID=1348253 RepID=UPI000691DC42|nr:VaFE repeat-containing surface-anchored protein [Microbacterium mangrovi]
MIAAATVVAIAGAAFGGAAANAAVGDTFTDLNGATLSMVQLSGGGFAYCIDYQVTPNSKGTVLTETAGATDPVYQSATVRGKVLWILAHGYPVLSKEQMEKEAGVTIPDSQGEPLAGFETQDAIWQVTTGIGSSGDPMSDWLVRNAVPITSYPAPTVHITKGANFASVDSGLVGPFVVDTEGMPDAAVTGSSGAQVVNAQGQAITDVADNGSFYLKVSQAGSYTATASGDGWSLGHIFKDLSKNNQEMVGGLPVKASDQISVSVQDNGPTPSISTTATDKADGDKVLPASGGVVKDVVSYTGLTPGVEYTMSGELMDKATGKGTGIKASKTFTPTSANGSVETDFTVPAGDAGRSLVAFEDLTDANGAVAKHEDINSAAQTVTVDTPAPAPAISTTATDKADGDKELEFRGGVVKDVVAYKNLTPGTQYTMSGELMDKATGTGTGIKASKTFTPTSANGSVEIDFTVPAGDAGKSLVAFEDLTDANGAVAKHEDINSAAQTVVVDQAPTIATTATDKSDGDKVLPFRGGVVKDVVSYKGLTPGIQYTMSGELMDKATGTGTGIKGSKTFTPTSADGSVEIDFTVPAGEAGRSLVAFESLIDAKGEVAKHADINSAAQTVTVGNTPAVSTTATDKSDGDQELSFRGGVVSDIVKYTNLVPGVEYTMSGELMDKATGKSTGITGSKTFTPTTANGSVEIDFTVPAKFAGHDLVAFEKVADSSGVVAKHEDINAKSQTVHVDNTPAVSTTATDKSDGDQELSFRGGVVSDIVKYTNLVPGVEYTMSGELMDKATGKSTGITGSKTFTPTTANGSVEIDFTVPAKFAGHDLVAFEKIADSSGVVAKHEDINAKSQTVSVDEKPAVTTTATDKADGDKELPSNGGVVSDIVKYTGLVPGTEYTVNGVLMDKAAGKSTGITASKKFTPAAADGSVEIDFNLPTGFAGDDLVAFEKVLDARGVVATHEDINAKSQTVHVDKPFAPITPTPKAPTYGPSVNTGGTVDNGGSTGGWMGGALAAGIIALVGAAGIGIRRKTTD